jgi:Na+-transporting NADH:ubiquinone oxidoreductase subunit NqrD
MGMLVLTLSILAAISAFWISLVDKKASRSTKVLAGIIAIAAIAYIFNAYYTNMAQATFEVV